MPARGRLTLPARIPSICVWLVLGAVPGLVGCDDEAEKQGAAPAVPSAHASTSKTPAEPSPAAKPPERRAERSVFDLVDNRLLAHLRVGSSLHLDASSAGFARYTRFRTYDPEWTTGVERAGVRAAAFERSKGKSAVLEVPLTRADADSFDTLVLRVHAKRAGRLTVRIGGDRKSDTVARLELRKGWQTARVAIPAGKLIEGENTIGLGPARGHHALAWVRLGQAADLTALEDEPENENETPGRAVGPAFESERHAFTVASGDGLTYYIHVPETGHLVADIEGVDGTGDCRIEARAEGRESSVDGSLSGPLASLSLEALAGQVVRLSLRAAGCPTVRLIRPRITVAGAAPEEKRGPPPKYVVLWVMDTLRADRVRPFQPDARPEVPVFDRLAETGTVFRQYWVQGNESQTSHASVWTSLYPKNHKVRTAGNSQTHRIAKRMSKLPKQLVDAGYFTIGVTANGYVTKYGRYGDDFEVWRNVVREGLAVRNNIPSNQILDIGLEYLKENYEKGPVFLFLGTIDTHKPWIARKPWIDRYDTKPYDGKHKEAAWPGDLGLVKGSMSCRRVPKERDLERINAIYDSNVSFQDQELGRFLETLEKWGIADETMLIVTADHGEELWEVGRCGHGGSLRETLTRVPLLIHYPPMFPGRVVMEGAEGVDILPTVMDVLERPVFDAAQGHSLVPLAQGVTGGYPMPSYASQYEYAHAMRLANWKLRVGRPGGIELYDLVADPEEMTDVHADRPLARRFMADALYLFLAHRHRWKKRDFGVPSNMTGVAACELERPAKRGEKGDGEKDPCRPESKD